MPHFKCDACQTRLYRARAPREQVGDLCTECGTLLEPVSELAELVGLRSIRPRDGDPGRHQLIADRTYDFLGYRDRRVTRGARTGNNAVAAVRFEAT